MGMTPKYENPEAMQKAIDAYFEDRDARDKPYTVTGMALALDFTSRNALLNYEGKEEFIGTIKRAKMRIENQWEEALRGPHVTGPIFQLKANYRWQDPQRYEHGGESLVEAIKSLGKDLDRENAEAKG